MVWSNAEQAYYATLNSFVSGSPRDIFVYDDDLNLLDEFEVDDPLGVNLRGLTVNEGGVFVAAFLGGTTYAYGFEFDGTPRWNVSWVGDAGLSAIAIEITTDDEGSVIVAGRDETMGGDLPALYKLDPDNGDIRWNVTIDVPGFDRGYLLGVTTGPDNRIVAVGSAGVEGQATKPLMVSVLP